MSLPIIDGNTEKTVENIYSRVKHEISLHPKASIAGLLTVAGLTKAISFLQTKNPDDLGSISQAGSRVFQLYSPEIISNSMDAFDSVAKGLYESGASQILKDEGISGLTKYVPLACAGLIKGAGYYSGETPSVTRKEINVPEDTAEEKKVEQNAEEEKHGRGRLYVGVGTVGAIGLALIGYLYTQTTGESTGTPPQSTGIDPVNDPVIPVETDTPDYTPDATPTAESTEEPTAEPTQEPTPIETPVESQHLYDLNPGYVKIVLEADENLFGIKIEGSMVDGDKAGWETIRDDNENIIFNRETYTPSNFDLYGEIWPDQASALEAEYGEFVSLTMEQIDTDGGGMDKVAVQFVGSEGVGELITDHDGFDGVGHYLSLGIYYNLFK